MIPSIKLIADSGSTKTEWCILKNIKETLFTTQGMSPYFLNAREVEEIIQREVIPFIKKTKVNEIFFYGTGCKNPVNKKMFTSIFQKYWALQASMALVIFTAMEIIQAVIGKHL